MDQQKAQHERERREVIKEQYTMRAKLHPEKRGYAHTYYPSLSP
jgi:hypothetical protein